MTTAAPTKQEQTHVSDSTRQRIIKQYSMSSATYDGPRLADPKGRLLSEFDIGLFRRMLPLPTPGATVVEFGAGTGRFTLTALDAGYTVTATDINESLLSGLQEKIEQAGLTERCKTQIENIYDLSFDDHSVDFGYSLHVLPRFLALADQQTAVRELARVIKPGGRLLFNYRNRRSLIGLFYKGYACTSAEMGQLLAEAGFRVVTRRGKWFMNKKLLLRLPLFIGRMVAMFDRMMLAVLPGLAWDVFMIVERKKDTQ